MHGRTTEVLVITITAVLKIKLLQTYKLQRFGAGF